jgi:hypothetical protein
LRFFELFFFSFLCFLRLFLTEVEECEADDEDYREEDADEDKEPSDSESLVVLTFSPKSPFSLFILSSVKPMDFWNASGKLVVGCCFIKRL